MENQKTNKLDLCFYSKTSEMKTPTDPDKISKEIFPNL
jgi:hypothetical protein